MGENIETIKTKMQTMQPRMVATINENTKELSKPEMQQSILEQRTTKIKTNCHFCGKEINVKPDKSRKSKHRYCSQECQINGRKIPKEKRTCKRCGNEFEVERYRKVKFCSKSCGAGNKKIKRICKNCKKEFEKTAYHVNKLGYGLFCSLKCRIEYKVKENSTNWKGGISFEPYCEKFTRKLKEEIRKKHNNKCYICTKEDKQRKLSIHHCDYNKSQGCKGLKWSLLPLCIKCHAKTNTNRWYWFALLRDYWIYETEIFKKMEMIATM